MKVIIMFLLYKLFLPWGGENTSLDRPIIIRKQQRCGKDGTAGYKNAWL
jgi:hypothetical protein